MAWILIQGRRNSDNFDALKSIIITMWPQNGEVRVAGRNPTANADIFQEVAQLWSESKRKTLLWCLVPKYFVAVICAALWWTETRW